MHCADDDGVTLSILNLHCKLCSVMVVFLFHFYISIANYDWDGGVTLSILIFALQIVHCADGGCTGSSG